MFALKVITSVHMYDTIVFLKLFCLILNEINYDKYKLPCALTSCRIDFAAAVYQNPKDVWLL